ncbi:hypothetical protein BpHYR1_047147 [Brachionus plicatilis]|uniref:Uncharacterized protein n=1 Tax=Brachionus plicatilis TaxID=10195 RepID=A0A3M7QQL0_BRAPC|nr:hypothetical protein BpHYR1_047147 [Brachionus plicatilis]
MHLAYCTIELRKAIETIKKLSKSSKQDLTQGFILCVVLKDWIVSYSSYDVSGKQLSQVFVQLFINPPPSTTDVHPSKTNLTQMIVVCFVFHMIKCWRTEDIHLNTTSIKLECDKHFGCTEILNKEKKFESIINPDYKPCILKILIFIIVLFLFNALHEVKLKKSSTIEFIS